MFVEGVLKFQLARCLCWFILDLKAATVGDVNDMLENFPYSHHQRADRPSKVKKAHFKVRVAACKQHCFTALVELPRVQGEAVGIASQVLSSGDDSTHPPIHTHTHTPMALTSSGVYAGTELHCHIWRACM